MKVYAWLIDLIRRRKNCPTGVISGWVTEHREIIQYRRFIKRVKTVRRSTCTRGLGVVLVGKKQLRLFSFSHVERVNDWSWKQMIITLDKRTKSKSLKYTKHTRRADEDPPRNVERMTADFHIKQPAVHTVCFMWIGQSNLTTELDWILNHVILINELEIEVRNFYQVFSFSGGFTFCPFFAALFPLLFLFPLSPFFALSFVAVSCPFLWRRFLPFRFFPYL